MYGEILRKCRKKAKLSQEKVAEIINTSRSNISKYENEELEPNIETIIKFCELYEITSDELLGIDKTKKEKVHINYSINQTGNHNTANMNINKQQKKEGNKMKEIINLAWTIISCPIVIPFEIIGMIGIIIKKH